MSGPTIRGAARSARGARTVVRARRCPMEQAPAPIYTRQGELRVEIAIGLPPCPECGTRGGR